MLKGQPNVKMVIVLSQSLSNSWEKLWLRQVILHPEDMRNACLNFNKCQPAYVFKLCAFFFFFFFSIRVFFHRHWQLTGQQGKGGDHLIPLYHFHPLTNIQTFICNFVLIQQQSANFLLYKKTLSEQQDWN